MDSSPRLAAIFVVSALAATVTGAALAASAAPASAPSPIGPDAVWKPPEDFRNRVTAACGNAGAKFSDCFAGQMKKAGASRAAQEFTRRTGNQGYLASFLEAGRVDVAYAEYPFRANENALVFLVNGNPPMLDVDDPSPSASGLDTAKLESNAAYAALKKRYPNLALFPGDRRPPRAVQTSPRSQGGQRFILRFELHDGCHACRTVGVARIAFVFDDQGRYEGTRILQIRSVSR